MGTALRDDITGELIIEWRDEPPPGAVVGEQHTLVTTPTYPRGIFRWTPPFPHGETLAERRRWSDWCGTVPDERPWRQGPGGLLGGDRWRTGREAAESAREITEFDAKYREEYDLNFWQPQGVRPTRRSSP